MARQKFKPIQVREETYNELVQLKDKISEQIGTKLSMAATIEILMTEHKEFNNV